MIVVNERLRYCLLVKQTPCYRAVSSVTAAVWVPVRLTAVIASVSSAVPALLMPTAL